MTTESKNPQDGQDGQRRRSQPRTPADAGAPASGEQPSQQQPPSREQRPGRGQQQPPAEGAERPQRGQQRPAGGQPQSGQRGPRQGGRPEGGRPAQAPAPPSPPAKRVVPTLLTRYREQIVPALRREFGYTNQLQAPKVVKVVLNIGVGKEVTAQSANPNIVERASADLAAISGQKPVVRGAKRAIAGFKLRAGQPVGVSVTLRGDRMYSFLERLLLASLPRIRDFRGTSRDAFDGRGNYALGIREQIIFPEIEYSQVDRLRGLQVNIVTSARTDREAFRLLELMGMPFARDGAQAAPA